MTIEELIKIKAELLKSHKNGDNSTSFYVLNMLISEEIERKEEDNIKT